MEGYFKLRIESEVCGVKFWREAIVLREMWNEFSEGEREAFAHSLMLKSVKTNSFTEHKE